MTNKKYNIVSSKRGGFGLIEEPDVRRWFHKPKIETTKPLICRHIQAATIYPKLMESLGMLADNHWDYLSFKVRERLMVERHSLPCTNELDVSYQGGFTPVTMRAILGEVSSIPSHIDRELSSSIHSIYIHPETKEEIQKWAPTLEDTDGLSGSEPLQEWREHFAFISDETFFCRYSRYAWVFLNSPVGIAQRNGDEWDVSIPEAYRAYFIRVKLHV